MLAPYRRIFATPHLPGLLALSLLARLYMTGMALALTFLVADWTGSYTVAGVVTAAEIIGVGIGGPLRGRAVDRRPAPRILILTAVGYLAGMGVLAMLPPGWWPLAPVLAFLAGLSAPPANQVARMLWSRLPDHRVREATYAANATFQELLFMVGPVLSATLVATISPRVAVAACGLLAVLGAVGFAAAVHRSGMPTTGTPAALGAPRRRTVLRSPGLLPLLIMMLLLVSALTAGDMVLVAWARDRGSPGLAGVLGAVWAVGSLTGGLLIAGRAGQPRLMLRVGAAAIGLALLVPVLPPVLANPSPWLVGVVLVIGGTAIAPAIAASNSRLGALAPDDRRGEAFGWMTTASTAGGAMAAPIIGALLDHRGPSVAAGFAALLVVVAVALARLVPSPASVPQPAPAAQASAPV